MGPDAGTHARNVAIIFALALIVWLVPGGDTGSATIANLLTLLLLGGLSFLAYRMYMEHRITLLDMEDRARLVLYGSFALLAFAIVATRRLWDTGGAGALLWLAMMAAAIYGLYATFRAQREY